MHLLPKPALLAIFPLILIVSPVHAKDGPPPNGALEELRRSFTLGGASIPPLVFRDMGDGNPADAKPMLVTIDAWAAIDSNQYADEIGSLQGWTTQTSASPDGAKATETERYRYLGATPDGLMVVVTTNSTSDGSYAPAALHVLDASLARALDSDGKSYERVDLTTLGAYSLGDGWNGEATLTGDVVTIKTAEGAAHPREPSESVRTIVVKRP
jgi:hypothetical protein